MVASVGTDLYTPFQLNLTIEDGVQSSEEGSNSDIHSPIFEAPYPPEVRYHLNHQLHIPDASTPLIPAPFNARYPAQHDIDIQPPNPHLLGTTIQPPNPPSVQHLLPHQHLHVDYTRLQHPVLDLGMAPPSLIQPPPALSPTEEYSFNIAQSRLPEQPLRSSYDAPPATTRGSIAMTPAEQKPQPSALSSPASNGNASGGSPQSQAGPSRPRREASTVVIACRQCRARKIRCDSTRPVCNNCTRRGNECEYDAVPKRRGPDKRPGTRQRSCKKRPPEVEPPAGSNTLSKKKRRIEGDHDGNLISFDAKDVVINSAKRSLLVPKPVSQEPSVVHLPQAPSHALETSVPHTRGIASDAIYPKDGFSPTAPRHSPYPTFNTMQPQPPQPQITIDYDRRTWWNNLLNIYANTPQDSMNAIFDDLAFLIDNSSYWLFFLNQQTLFENLQDDRRRGRIQPSLVLSALAMANLMRSSELEQGETGRQWALKLRNAAQASMEAACNSDDLDFTLAEAAIILALFESSSHPQYSAQRAVTSLRFVDRIIHALSLTMVDVENPIVSSFHPDSAPTVFFPPGYTTPVRCACSTHIFPLSPGSPQNAYNLSTPPAWGPNVPEEMRKEECRRICWSALNLVASYTAQCAAFHEDPVDLQLTDPSRYNILFPGEASALQQPSHISPKESVWALYCRSMLLWTSCVRQRDNDHWATQERADFAIAAWIETNSIQDGLDMHQCNSDTALIYMCREYMYNTRMTIQYEFRRLQGIDGLRPQAFNRKQAEEWLHYQEQVAHNVRNSVMLLGEAQGHLLSRRPFQSVWYSSQVSLCLALWAYDHSLLRALELAKMFLIPLETLDALWPCQFQSIRSQELRRRVVDACTEGGVNQPLPTHLNLPPILRRPGPM